MKISTLIRTSSALPVLPMAIILVVLYYSENTHAQISYFSAFPDAAVLIQRSIEPMYAVTYAIVSAAAAWQGARLKEAGVWHAAPYRPHWRIIAVALAPIIALGWLMFTTPIAMAFFQTPTLPTFSSLPPLFLGLLLVVAHAVVGFTVGQKVKPLIAAPVLLCSVFVVVAFSHSTTIAWPRHMAGEYSAGLGFGETATFLSMVAEFLPTASVAAAAVLFWFNAPIVTRVAAGAVVVAVGSISSYVIVMDWDHNPSVNIAAEKVCEGGKPEVCLPKRAADDIGDVKKEVDETYAMLISYGVIDGPPEVINDNMLYGRYTQNPTPRVRYLPLSLAHRSNELPTYVIKDSAHPLCEMPIIEESRKIRFWLDRKMGKSSSYADIASGDPYHTRAKHEAIVQEVSRVSELPTPEQRSWYLETAKKACEERP